MASGAAGSRRGHLARSGARRSRACGRTSGSRSRSGIVAAGRDVEVMHLDPGDHRRDGPRVALAADVERRRVLDRQARGDGDAVPALLAGDLQVRQAGVRRTPRVGNSPSRHLISCRQSTSGAASRDEARHLFGAQAHGVDVPGGKSQAHGCSDSAVWGSSGSGKKTPGRLAERPGVEVVSHAAAGRGLVPARFGRTRSK